MAALVGLIILLSNVILAEPFTLVSPHLYKTDTGGLQRNVSRLTEKVRTIDERVQSNKKQLQSVVQKTGELETGNTKMVKSSKDRFKNLEQRVTQLALEMEDIEKGSLEQNVTRLTKRVEAIDGLVQSNQKHIQSVAIKAEGTDNAKTVDDRFKTLEESLRKLKADFQEEVKARSCPPDFISNDDPKLCFKVIDTFSGSSFLKRMWCSYLVEGGHMLKIDNPRKLAVVQKQLKKGRARNYMAGGELSPESKKWEWHDGTPVDLTLFCPGQPDSGHRYLSLRGERGYCLDNIGDENHLAFVCEMPM